MDEWIGSASAIHSGGYRKFDGTEWLGLYGWQISLMIAKQT